VISFKCCRKETGVSATTCSTRIRVWKERRSAWEEESSFTHFQILDESLEESYEMFGLPYITWNSFFEEVVGQYYRMAT
jgi:hypothetical protein